MSTVADPTMPPVPAPQPTSPASANDPRPIIGGRYTLDLATPLGGGGICLVYGGHDLRTRRPVAVKTLRQEYHDDPDTRARFRREARLLAFIAHPNVVRVYDFVEDRGATWVVLEQITGASLRQVIDRRGPLPPAEVAPLLDQAAAGLMDLHERGLVHLDVKPQNLLLTDDQQTLKLIDFGLTQAAGLPQEAIGGRTFGTAAYLAPEQARGAGEPVGPATDQYALACVAYELLTGHPPFAHRAGHNPGRLRPTPKDDLIRARRDQSPVAPTLARPDLALPPWVDDLLLRALAPDPAARFADVDTFARRFRAGVEADEPGEGATLVGPPPARPRPPPPARRHRAIAVRLRPSPRSPHPRRALPGRWARRSSRHPHPAPPLARRRRPPRRQSGRGRARGRHPGRTARGLPAERGDDRRRQRPCDHR